VRVEYVGAAPLEGTDDRQLLATLRDGSPAPAPSSVMIASARPFIPHARVPIADVPVPAGRPYDLGEDDGAGNAATSGWNLRTSTTRQAPPSEVTARARTAPYAPAPVVARRRAPVTAASAIPSTGLSFSNGRGLY
jgi:rare lipoprotein A